MSNNIQVTVYRTLSARQAPELHRHPALGVVGPLLWISGLMRRNNPRVAVSDGHLHDEQFQNSKSGAGSAPNAGLLGNVFVGPRVT